MQIKLFGIITGQGIQWDFQDWEFIILISKRKRSCRQLYFTKRMKGHLV